MKKEFLENYSENEDEEHDRLVEKLLSGNTQVTLPDISRFGKIYYPMVKADLLSYSLTGEEIWSQIPFAGTLIIPLFNISKEHFKERHGFETSDIPKLIELSKMGKIKFGLASSPLWYENCDHLSMIFEEIKPPQLWGIPWNRFIDPTDYQSWKDEFDTLAKIKYLPWLINQSDNFREKDDFLGSHYDNRMNIYASIKFLGLTELAEEISNKLIDDPFTAQFLLNQFVNVCGDSVFDGLKLSINNNIAKMQYYNTSPKDLNSKIHYPIEIGSSLMKKLSNLPTSYESCISIIDNYKGNDLYRLLESLDAGIKSEDRYKITETSKGIEEIVDNLWKDSLRLQSAKNTLRIVTNVSIGLAGNIGTSLLGAGLPGLISNLGFPVLDKILNFDKLSEKVVKALNKNYLVFIYEFRKKYGKI